MDEKEKSVVASLKEALKTPSVSLYREVKISTHYTLHTDVCDKYVGCVFLQEQEDGRNRRVSYPAPDSNDKEPKLATTH